MKHSIRTTLAVSALVAVSALALPTAAQASTIYPPAGSCTVSPTTTTAGGQITFRCAEETFSADESVTITVTGENGSDASIGMIKFAVSTASGTTTSNATGGVSGTAITLPSNATGIYNIAAVSATSAGGTAAVTVTAADGSLPVTGLDSSSMMGLWVGGAALLLTGAVLAIAAFVRRSHRNAN